MANPDRFSLASQDLSTPKVFPGSLRRCLPGLLIFSFCIFGSPIGQAQEQQPSGQQQDQNRQTQQDQDVAKAAREERARKQVNPSKPRHVYTAEDLKRDQILTPEDRAMFDASRRQWTPLVTTPALDALDAQSLSPGVPLGDIARSLQRQKELMRLRRSNEFHLPFPEAPVLAAPKLPIQPLHPSIVLIEPARPAVVGPFHPPVKRSPFERPRILAPEFAAPHASSPALPKPRVAPPAPETPRHFAATPSAPRVSPKKLRAVPAPDMPGSVAPAPMAPQISPSAPKAPRDLISAKPSQPTVKTPRSVVAAPEMPHTVAPAPMVPQVSPSLPTTPRNLNAAKPVHPAFSIPRASVPAPEMPRAVVPAPVAPQAAPSAPKVPHSVLPATPVRPALKAPRTIVPAPPVYHVVPKTPAFPVTPPVSPAIANVASPSKMITIQPGDSLWKIAEQHLGNGLRWQELLSVNPGISDPSRIVAGAQIVLPAGSPQRSTKYTVHKGDTLWAIAQSHLGRATAWSCVARANPEVSDANLIREGQVLSLPPSCLR